MRTTLEQLCNNFIRNRDVVKSILKWENEQVVSASVTSFLNRGISADASRLEECKKLLKESTGVISNFRGNVEVPMVIQLSIADDPENKMKRIMKIYEILKKEFWGSEYLVLTAAVMADMISEEEAVQMTQKALKIYNKMKKDHPFLTSGEDSIYAFLMAISEKSDEVLMEEMEVCYKLLKESFSAGNQVQALSHILSIAEGSPKEKCEKVVSLYNALRNSDVKYGKNHELMALASLAMLPVEQSVLVEDIKDVDTFLAQQKGYGFFALDKKTRLMHAAMIVSCDYIKNDTADIAVMTSALAVVAAQQTAMCACIVASAAVCASN